MSFPAHHSPDCFSVRIEDGFADGACFKEGDTQDYRDGSYLEQCLVKVLCYLDVPYHHAVDTHNHHYEKSLKA